MILSVKTRVKIRVTLLAMTFLIEAMILGTQRNHYGYRNELELAKHPRQD